MKNIHILPTEKPSRLVYEQRTFIRPLILKSEPISITKDSLGQLIHEPQNIYITSDEEIKEGMWFLPINGIGWKLNIPIKADGNGGYHNEHCKKIILTTDNQLIDDGVQPVTNTFAEWFVKNQSCECVTVERLEDGQYVDRFADGSVVEGIYENYQIIIPQEKPKQIKCYCGHTTTCDCGPLEEPKESKTK